MENLTLQELQDLRASILSNTNLTEQQIADLHLINKLDLIKSKLTEEEIAFSEALENKIKEAKDECTKRISSYDGKTRSLNDWVLKSQNLQDAKTTYSNILIAGGSPTLDQISDYNLANTIIDRKNQLVIKYRALENTILACQTIEELDLIIIKDDNHWVLI
jgi:hypothetical protein